MTLDAILDKLMMAPIGALGGWLFTKAWMWWITMGTAKPKAKPASKKERYKKEAIFILLLTASIFALLIVMPLFGLGATAPVKETAQPKKAELSPRINTLSIGVLTPSEIKGRTPTPEEMDAHRKKTEGITTPTATCRSQLRGGSL